MRRLLRERADGATSGDDDDDDGGGEEDWDLWLLPQPICHVQLREAGERDAWQLLAWTSRHAHAHVRDV